MGRRKIEIQPITHERNRSVTFLKRKNGLFKKAYELGVLCSVDVAVIIFEERPNGHVKLHQYCSSDVHNIVQRHLHHDGERDTLGPLDFSNNAGATRADDGGDGDKDDDGDDGDDMEIPAVSTRAGVKRNGDGKPRHPLSGSGLDTINQPRMHLPRNISYHPMQEHEHEHPMSSDRLSLQHHPHPHQAKKPRLDTSLQPHPHSHLPPPYPPHSPAESLSHPHPRSASTGSASGGYTYPPPPPPPPQQQPSQWFESLVHISHRGSQQQHPHHSHSHHQHQHPHHQKGGYPPPPGYLNDPSTLFSTFVPASPASHTHHPHGTPPMPSPLAQPPPSIAPPNEFAIPTPTSRARGEPTTPVGAWPLSGAPPSSSGSSGSPASWGVNRRESAVGGGGKEEGVMGGSGVGGGGGEGLSESGD